MKNIKEGSVAPQQHSMSSISSDPVLVQNVIAAVKDAYDNRRPLTGSNIVRVDGPGGEWRVRQEQTSRGSWKLYVYEPNPSRKVYHSIAKVKTALSVVGKTGSEADDPDLAEYFVSDRLALAASVIQCTFLGFTARRAKAMISRTDAKIADLEQQLEKLRDLQVLRAERSIRFKDLFLESMDSEVVIRSFAEPLLIQFKSSLDTTQRKSETLVDVIDLHTNLTRESLFESASMHLATENKNTPLYMCARAILKTPHFALVTCTLPLPEGPLKFKDKYVSTTVGVLSDQHRTMIRKNFKAPFMKHVDHMMSNMPVVAFDLFDDVRMTKYLGGIVMAKYGARRGGRLYPVIDIESVCSMIKFSGTGEILLDLAKALLFTDSLNVDHGFVVAQCIDIAFWKDRLDICPLANALLYQINTMYSSHRLHTDCVYRARRFDPYDLDTSFPSPTKK